MNKKYNHRLASSAKAGADASPVLATHGNTSITLDGHTSINTCGSGTWLMNAAHTDIKVPVQLHVIR